MAGLPEELIEGILLRLPVNSLLRFKTASKNWYSLISEDHEFAKRHLKQSSSNSPSKNLLFLFEIYSAQAVAIFQSSDSHTYKIDIPDEIPWSHVVGSANGLICISPFLEEYFFLWNPTIGVCKRISSPTVLKSPNFLTSFGYYDSHSDDYKIVGAVGNSQFGIFSLKETSWKIHERKHEVYGRAILLNGALHWRVYEKIVAFDLAKEEFFDIEIPVKIRIDCDLDYIDCKVSLFDWQGLLCLYGCGSVWAMKEYGVTKSWANIDQLLPPVENPRLSLVQEFKKSLISPKYFISDQQN